jgi:hypothetical protein
MKKLTPGQHGLLDYAVGATNMVAPALLGTSDRSRIALGAFGAGQTAVNAITAQPYSLSNLLSWKTHRKIDFGYLAAYAVVPPLLGVAKDRRARWLWLAVSAAGVAVFACTDWKAKRTADR